MSEYKQEQPISPYMAMFEEFRKELDEHHDRRERIVKASRDITAASKKIIFTLQRVRKLGVPLPPYVNKSNEEYWKTIETRFREIAPDVQNVNAYRYPQLTWGNQEFMEALSFQHYLETQTLISYEQAKSRVAALCGDGPTVPLTIEDYVLGIYDMIGELMRFSITAMALNGNLPAGEPRKAPAGEDSPMINGEETAAAPEEPRNVLTDMRHIEQELEFFHPGPGTPFEKDVNGKAKVMHQCIGKVELANYSLTVRGKERPKGWRPDLAERPKEEDTRAEVETF
ncbi:Translin [Westerdykella ornata]|uniref:Translin n=1 Tax=Westerdykella ornata TaxID=318751 RepID=A0A6A6JJ39_WESOR|nr:Translin [Westerdykella ornata]KAF2275978.1 Translin [Westerdykella ornata]